MGNRQIIMSQVMLPNQANVAGNVHGGEIMKFMDTTAGAVAIKYSKSNCVTARVDELEFHLPIFVGALVTCTATVVYVGRTSMEVFVNVEVEDLEANSEPQKALSAYFTMVAMGRNGRPQDVPQFTPETEDEIRLHEEAKARVEAHREKKKAKQNKK
ncbi:MAG: acyl-CoA thioesterase [Aminipila sp.]